MSLHVFKKMGRGQFSSAPPFSKRRTLERNEFLHWIEPLDHALDVRSDKVLVITLGLLEIRLLISLFAIVNRVSGVLVLLFCE